MESLLLATKLRIPSLPQHGVRRTRLLEVLTRALPRYKLVLLSAPAGYGKTTLLAQWAQASRVQSAAGIVALWPLAYAMWRHPEARTVGEARPLPAT